MLKKIVNKAVDKFLEMGIIDSERRVIYEYGLEQGVILILNILTVLVIGIVSGEVLISITFMVVYIPLRTYAGGYHAKKLISCYLISVGIAIGAIVLVQRVEGITFWTGIPFALIIYALAPVEAAQKKLNKKQKEHYKRKVGGILLILLLVCIGNYFVNIRYISETIVVAESVVCVAEIVGYFTNKIQLNQNMAQESND